MGFSDYAVVVIGGSVDPLEAFQQGMNCLALDVAGAYLKTMSVYGKFYISVPRTHAERINRII